MSFKVIRPDQLEWQTRPRQDGEPARHAGALTEVAGFEHTRANLWRYEPGAKGCRHKELLQEETFVVIEGTLSIYLGEAGERYDVGPGGLVHVEAGTPLQIMNDGMAELVLFAYGAPPERGHAEFLDPVV